MSSVAPAAPGWSTRAVPSTRTAGTAAASSADDVGGRRRPRSSTWSSTRRRRWSSTRPTSSARSTSSDELSLLVAAARAEHAATASNTRGPAATAHASHPGTAVRAEPGHRYDPADPDPNLPKESPWHRLADNDVVIVEAVRSPLGRRNGGLATVHPVDLLGAVQRAAIERSGIDPRARRPGHRRLREPGRRADVQHRPHRVARAPACRSRSRRTHRRQPVRLVATGHEPRGRRWSTSGVVDVALGVRRRVDEPRAARRRDPRRLRPPDTRSRTSSTTSSRASSKARSASPTSGASPAPTATSSGSSRSSARSGRGPKVASSARSLPIDAPDVDDEGKPTGTTHHVARDEGLRETSLEALAKLKPVARENGVHTAGSSSQITDGAAAVLAHDRARGRASSACGRGRASSTSASSASTRC